MFNLSILTQTQHTFEGKKDYEHVLTLLYRHWYILAKKATFFAIMALMPFLLYVLLSQYVEDGRILNLFWFAVSLYFLLWWSALFYALTMYLLDTWIVTDHRILDSQQFGFFKRSVSELNLSKIQDISVEVNGPIATFLDFGNLEVQTAGTERKFKFEEIPFPRTVKDQIMHAHNEYISRHPEGREVHESSQT